MKGYQVSVLAGFLVAVLGFQAASVSLTFNIQARLTGSDGVINRNGPVSCETKQMQDCFSRSPLRRGL